MKQILNTILRNTINVNENEKFIYWGSSTQILSLSKNDVLALDGANSETESGELDGSFEKRTDRFKTFYNYFTEGNYIVICIPVSFGGVGKFEVSGLTTIFHTMDVITDFVDHMGNAYHMNVFISAYKYNGIVPEIEIL